MSGHSSNAVFISYRRDVAGILAMALYQDLTQRGIDAFYDIESLRAGQFDTIILNQIAARPYFMLVLTPGTLERCDDPNDWLRREMEQAVLTTRVIVPVHTPNFDWGDFERFVPVDLGDEVRRFNGQELPQQWFKYGVQKLVDEFLLPVGVGTPAAPAEEQAVVDEIVRHAQSAPAVTEEELSAQQHFERGLARASDDLDNTIAEYSKAIEFNPQDARVFHHRARALADRGDLAGAIADAEEGARLAPGDERFSSLLDELAKQVPVLVEEEKKEPPAWNGGGDNDDTEPEQPRWRTLAPWAGALAATIVGLLILVLVNGPDGDGWSEADVGSDVLHEGGSQVLNDVALEGDGAVAVGRYANKPGIWTYDGPDAMRDVLGGSGAMHAVAASPATSPLTVVAVGMVHAGGADQDGMIWTRTGNGWKPECPKEECGGKGKQEVLAVAATSRGFIAVGRVAGSDVDFDAAVWRSDDGNDWIRVADGDPDLGGGVSQVMRGVVEVGDRLVAVGRNGRKGAAWTSTDGGQDWTLAPGDAFPAAEGGEVEVLSIVTYDGGLIAVGREEVGRRQAAAWYSDLSGEQWTRAEVTNEQNTGQQMIDVVGTRSGLIAVGSDRSSPEDSFQAAVWESRDGREWSAVASDSFAAPSGMEGVALLPGTVVAVGQDSGGGGIWLSDSGE